MTRLVGARVPRVEDRRLLRGRGHFVDDLHPPGLRHAAFVRSPFAHASVTAVDVTAARAMPGVDLVLTAADLHDVVGVMQGAGPEGLHTPAFGPLASDRVRFVGDPVAVVIAASRALAEDACERVDVTYHPLPALADVDTALASDAPAMFEAVGHNLMFEGHWTYGDPDAHFAAATRRGRWRFTQHRQCNAPLEGRAGLVDHDLDTGDFTYHAAHQNPHALRLFVADLLGIPAHRFHVHVGDVGGSFGQKAYVSREDVAVCAAGKLLAQPVKWVEDRVENLQAAGQAREERFDVEAAYDDDGTVRAVRVDMVFDQGAYQLTTLPPTIFPTIVRVLFPGAYRLRDLEFRVRVVATNKATYVAYRGPWEAETFVRERMLDEIASDVGLPPEVVRERNLLTSDELPTRLVTDVSFAHVTARETFERALSLADLDRFRHAQDAARAGGRLLGFGLATFVEPSPGPPDYTQALGAGAAPRSAQRATARLEPDGSLTIFTSQAPHGQGHHTTLAQLAADELGVPLAAVRVVTGDTQVTPFNLVGTGGSRAATLASGAVLGVTADIRRQVARLAAHLLEAAEDDIELVDGVASVRGVPASARSLAEIASVAYRNTALLPPDVTPGIDAEFDCAIPEGGWSQATHCCWVEIDPATGLVHIDRYLVVEDCGALINPTIVEGQIAGGVAQGIGGVLFERAAYDANGQLLTSTFVDYLLPTCTDIPPVEIHHLESAPQGPVDFRGVGEGGAIGAPAALCNAIADALRPSGAVVLDQHLPPTKILELLGTIGR
ncbi:MAG TPA: xanthine dehydrogenase family protein molybdopterin-binding subunit [Acidimicrobiia bacterium]|nr:xanthine dehydrogenase family protein molybdopterin-binding subunit [Acidimicrobiia bacterium]